jgi:hypothetical protein
VEPVAKPFFANLFFHLVDAPNPSRDALLRAMASPRECFPL